MIGQIDASPRRDSQTITLQRRPSTGTLHDSEETRGQMKQKRTELGRPPSNETLYYNFFDKSPAIRSARKTYLINMTKGVFLVSIWIFGVFSIYWGSLWKVPSGHITGWIVDFDGSSVGAFYTQRLLSEHISFIRWETVSASNFPGGIPQVMNAIAEEKAWFAVTIAPDTTARLNASLDIPDPSYNASTAVMVLGNEGRNEITYRNLIRTTLFPVLMAIGTQFAAQNARAHGGNLNLASILAISPQTIVDPIGFVITTVRVFTPPVAAAPMFVGLIYLTVLAFAIVAMSYNLREATGLNKILKFRSLLLLRLFSNVIIYFILSLFYTLVNRAFQINFRAHFGNAGLVIFWMLSWAGMMALGLALEAMISILTPRFMPFFLLIWIIVNVSVTQWPPVLLPSIFRYGYGAPFYHLSIGSRTIIFGIKNDLGLNFGVLIIWIAISCITLPIFQYIARKRTNSEKNPPVGNAESESEKGRRVVLDDHE